MSVAVVGTTALSRALAQAFGKTLSRSALHSYVNHAVACQKVVVIDGAERGEAPWARIGDLLGLYFRGWICLVGGSADFEGLDEEGVVCTPVITVFGSVLKVVGSPRIRARRAQTASRVASFQDSVLQKVANRDLHALPTFRAVGALFGGEAVAASRLCADFDTARLWVARFLRNGACADQRTAMTEMIDSLERLVAGGKSEPSSSGAADQQAFVESVTARWRESWVRFAAQRQATR